MPGRRRHGKQHNKETQQQQEQRQRCEQVQQPQTQHELQQPQLHQQNGRQQELPNVTATASTAGGMEEEVQRRLHICSANAIDISVAQMFAKGPEGTPVLIRCTGTQAGSWRRLLYIAEVPQKEAGSPLDKFCYKETWGEQLAQHSRGVASFVPDGSGIICTELPPEPYRLGLRFCVNRRSAVFLASFPVGGVGGALRNIGPQENGQQKPLQASWVRVSGDEDWAAWNPRVCESAAALQGPLLSFEVAYLALADDPQETRPHFGNARLRVATLARDGVRAPWVVTGRRTVVSVSPCLHDGPRAQQLQAKEKLNFTGQHEEGSLLSSLGNCICVAGPLRGGGLPRTPQLRTFQGLACYQLPPWRSRGFLLANTLIGCRQAVVAVCTGTEATGLGVRRVQFECVNGPNTPADVKVAAAAAAVGDVLLRDSWGLWLLVQASSPVHAPVLVVAKIKDQTVLDEPQDQTDPTGPPLIAELVDAFSLRGGPEGAFNGVRGQQQQQQLQLLLTASWGELLGSFSRDVLFENFCGVKKLQLHMATLSLYHLEAQRHWLIRLGKPPKGPADPSLAVLIHGGPHSCASCTYSRDVLFLTTLGFDVLAVNYRGSAGFGQEELLSVHEFMVKGFAPKLQHSVASQWAQDFVFPVSCGEDFAFSKTPSEASLQQMQRLSPTEFVSAVQTPLLLAVGGKDQRVPPSQGLLFWRLLNAQGKKNKLLWYPEDNHSLDGPAADADFWANTGVWFLKHLQQVLLPPL
ncbi:acylamino-acid-releasing enzyme, putative [Eimeria maxima]|uniref:Acylamino-acid-releasing enzyme, putative n=1 Tax=Eimeria maxima TaxID=5804 RepID=U6M8Q2_EIMMA|nr:acylamino-acid-releasing enzyme, putative [Eimeria maxima]CDJ60557.1 acylamino-acid-releasing enzyme, putative [Eimeria maxima]